MIKRSPVFKPSWFGEGSPANYYVDDGGRWAGVEIMTNARNFSDITNAWGLLRSPWNTNPAKYFTRHERVNGGVWEEMVGCSRMSKLISSGSLADVNNLLNGATHGPIHILTGGQWHTNSTLFDDGNRFSGIAGPLLLLQKHLWRYGFLRCPEICGADTPVDECVCSCPAEVMGNASAYDVLATRTPVAHWITKLSRGSIFWNTASESTGPGGWRVKHMNPDQQTSLWELMLHALCNPGHVGEMYTSAAPYDPLFWVIHPTGERVLSWRRLLKANGLLAFDETWGYSHNDDTSDFGRVCDWSNVTGLELPVCDLGVCAGHARDALLPFKYTGLHNGREYFTNEELYHFIHPLNTELPYMYDTFEYEQCWEQGYDMGWQYVTDWSFSSNTSTSLAANATSAGGGSLLTGTSSSSTTTTTTTSSSSTTTTSSSSTTASSSSSTASSSSAASASTQDASPTPRPSASPYRAPGRQ